MDQGMLSLFAFLFIAFFIRLGVLLADTFYDSLSIVFSHLLGGTVKE